MTEPNTHKRLKGVNKVVAKEKRVFFPPFQFLIIMLKVSSNVKDKKQTKIASKLRLNATVPIQ